jgi:hypothetical protein
MSFRVGDKVKVRKDLEVGQYGKDNLLVLPEMLPDRGHVFEIETIIGGKMFLKGSEWLWSPEMIEETSSMITLEVGYRYQYDTYVRTSTQTVLDDDYAYENACGQFLDEFNEVLGNVSNIDVCYVREVD